MQSHDRVEEALPPQPLRKVKSLYPNLSHQPANRAQAVRGEPNVVQLNLSRLRRTMDLRVPKSFIPIYPNNLPTVPKPPRASRTASLVFSELPASQGAITRLLNRFGGQNLQRGFESPPLRHILASIGVRGVRSTA